MEALVPQYVDTLSTKHSQKQGKNLGEDLRGHGQAKWKGNKLIMLEMGAWGPLRNAPAKQEKGLDYLGSSRGLVSCHGHFSKLA